jgi:hypothetical protein
MKEINEWKTLTDDITVKFLRDYFEIYEDEYINYYWIGDDTGTILQYNDYFIDFSTILDCCALKVSKEQFFSWYKDSVEEKTTLNLKEYIKSPQKREKERQEYLHKLKENVIFAEEGFKKALEEYGTEN